MLNTKSAKQGRYLQFTANKNVTLAKTKKAKVNVVALKLDYEHSVVVLQLDNMAGESFDYTNADDDGGSFSLSRNVPRYCWSAKSFEEFSSEGHRSNWAL